MSTSEPEKPKRRRRRARKPAEADASAAEAANAQQDEAAAEDETTRAASSSEAAADSPAEIEPSPADDAAEEAAADVMLEAEAEAGEPEIATPARRQRRRAAEPASEEPPPAPTPSRRRRREQPVGPPPMVRAQAKYVRSSARKARLVCDHIRGKSVEEARAILAHTPRAIARDWRKLLEAAVANAENNHELVGEDLYVKAVHADEGPTIRRFRPRAMGRATRIRKRTSHLTILLTPKE
jgi:ribosomal protein L22